MCKGMRKIMFGYKIKAMHKDAYAMHKGMRKMMCGHKIKTMHKGCVSYA